MRKDRYIFYFLVPVLVGLCSLLAWNGYRLYIFEIGQVQGRVERSINVASGNIQNYNASLLSNYARLVTDKDYHEKMAFSAGFTRNMGKISISFDEKPASHALDTAVHKTTDTTFHLNINKEYIRQNHIVFKPAAVKTVNHFDTAFCRQLLLNKAPVPYRISKAARADTSRKDTFVSQSFILDYSAPEIYSIHYVVPKRLVLVSMLPYISAAAVIVLLLIAASAILLRSYRLQVQLSQFRESLLGNITHELKTPLSSLQLIIDSAAKDSNGDETVIPDRHVVFAAAELRRMKLLVDRILSFTSMGRQQFVLNKEAVNLASVIEDAITAMGPAIARSGGKVTFLHQENLTLAGDPMLLTNAIAALIDNALKYNSNTPHIIISINGVADYAVVTVQDNGIGIPEQYKRKIFEPLFRVPAGNVYNTAGHGLGLSFVKQVADLHSGSISFTSQGGGTVFYFKLAVR